MAGLKVQEDAGIDICFGGEQSADLRTELAEVDQDYNSTTISEQDNASTGSESEIEQSLTELPHLSPEKSPLDTCEAAKLQRFCTETCKCKLGAKGTPCSSVF